MVKDKHTLQFKHVLKSYFSIQLAFDVATCLLFFEESLNDRLTLKYLAHVVKQLGQLNLPFNRLLPCQVRLG